jgi:hypothetical protein
VCEGFAGTKKWNLRYKNNKATKPKKGKTHASHTIIKSFFHATITNKR